MPDLGDYLQSLHLYGQHLLNPYLRGKISPGNTLHGSGFLELHSHEKCPIDHVIFFVFLCLKPAGSSPETQYAPPLSLFFFRYVTAQKRLMKRNSCAHTSRRCCGCRFRSVHLHGVGWLEIWQGREYPGTWGLKSQRSDGSGGGKSDTPLLTWRSRDHT